MTFNEVFMELIRNAVHKDDASDLVNFDMNGDWKGFFLAFKELFGEDFDDGNEWEDYEED